MTNAGFQIQQQIRGSGKLAPTGYTTKQANENVSSNAGAGTFNTAVTLGTWTKTAYTIAASGTVDIDLNDGSLLDAFGDSVAYTSILRACFQFQTGNLASSVRIGNAASNANQMWFGADAHTATIYSNGPALPLGGTAVTVDASNKIVKLENLDGVNEAKVYAWFAGGTA